MGSFRVRAIESKISAAFEISVIKYILEAYNLFHVLACGIYEVDPAPSLCNYEG